MKIIKRIFILCIISISFFISSIDLFAQVNSKSVSVKGYYNKNGTYVQPYHRTAPNSTNRDNYSTKGNVNPYTGKKGTVNPDNKSNNYNNPSTSNYYGNSNSSSYYSGSTYFHSESNFYLSGNLGLNSENQFSTIDSYGFSFGFYKNDYHIGYLMELFANGYTINTNIGLMYPIRTFIFTGAVGIGTVNIGDIYSEEYVFNASVGIDIRISNKISIPIRYETNGGMLLGGLAYNFRF